VWLRFLLVDDDPLVRAGTASMLEDLGHSVRTAASGEEALALARGDDCLGLVMSDQVMPGMSGAQLFEALRRERPALPLVLASGYAELPPGLDIALTRLHKPFDMARLGQAIAQALSTRG
jgi:CheY-like chemotaxis protein